MRESVFYFPTISAKGYVNVNGTATVIDNKGLLVRMKRDYWNSIPGSQDIFRAD